MNPNAVVIFSVSFLLSCGKANPNCHYLFGAVVASQVDLTLPRGLISTVITIKLA